MNISKYMYGYWLTYKPVVKGLILYLSMWQQKPRGGYSQKNWVRVWGLLPKILTLFMTKSVIFPTLFMTWPKMLYYIYDLTLKLMPSFSAQVQTNVKLL